MNLIQMIEQWAANGVLVTLIVSMIPVLELRAAIPIGVSLGLTHMQALAISIIGNCLPAPFIIIFVRRLFDWMKRKIPALRGFVARMEKKAETKNETIRRWQLLGLALFVAIPLPGTGAWTGAMIAGLLDIRLRRAMPAIIVGVVAAGILITGITYGFTNLLG